MPFSDSTILGHIARQPKKMASHKQLLHELGAKGNARRELADRLHALVKKGRVASGRWRALRDPANGDQAAR